MKRLKNFYVVSYRFDGKGRGFAIATDSDWLAYFIAKRLLLGFADVLSDWQLENRYPRYFHQLISKTA